MQEQQKAPSEFKVEEKVLVNVINYLAGKPYKETVDLITALQKSTPIMSPLVPKMAEKTDKMTVSPKVKE